MVLFGTIMNGISIIIGCLIGLFLNRIKEKYKETIIQGIGLTVILIGMQMAFQVNSIIIALLSMLTGAIVGEFFRLEDALNRVGNWIGGKFTNTNDDVNVERSEEHTSELQSRFDLVCRLLLEKKKIIDYII